MIILSIDSGLEKTGYAIFDKSKKLPDGKRFITSGLLKTSKNDTLPERFHSLFTQLQSIIKKNSPKCIILEQLFFFKNQKTAIQVSQTQGVIILLAAIHNIQIEFLTPLQIKQIVTGYGQADKKAVQKMLKLILGISIPSSRDDEADAIACGLAYCYLNKNLLG